MTEAAPCFGAGDELYVACHEREWGRPLRDERGPLGSTTVDAAMQASEPVDDRLACGPVRDEVERSRAA